ncbi:hypothetical protein CMV_018959 [Castanea mollissima]|uniref:Uncharacterized protein n=1 Tax=Castanea mollissima TaxID=60419 RepID=A0A8J4VP58_9ROSI|nr:hypothetical protein CMV_018959 [Castanea mollissima]
MEESERLGRRSGEEISDAHEFRQHFRFGHRNHQEIHGACCRGFQEGRSDDGPRSPHIPLSSAAVPVPLNLTSAYFELCMYPIHQGKTLPHAGEAHLTSNISDPSLPRRRRNTSLKPTLYNTRSTQDRSCCRR